MQDPEAVFTANGTPGTRGSCPVCGTKMFRMGRTPAHEGLTPPPADQRKTTKRRKRVSARKRRKGGKVVIVESPAKARTIGKFLGPGYAVKASVGHVRDLLRSRLSVDIEHDFTPTYRVPNDKRKVVKEIRSLAADADEVFLATDPDREGEAIAWHVVQAADIPEEAVRRVVFHEITRDAVESAFSQPREINMRLVDAQQARRVLDRLVGYQITPLLWRKVQGGLSAGRVQSVALRLIVEREREIEAFVPEEYWSLSARLSKRDRKLPKSKREFLAALHRLRGVKPDLKNEADTQAIVTALDGATYVVTKVLRKERTRRPAAPFTTSTLQQEASRRLGFGARRTMRVAQQLYEGINLGAEGSVGLITYMRTDSVNVSAQAQAEAREVIAKKYGPQYLPKKPPFYKTRAKGAQEAHEAIRPTSVRRFPEAVKQFLNRDQARLYKLIWDRFVASQMAPAIYDQTTADVVADTKARVSPRADLVEEGVVKALAKKPDYLFRATGSVIKFAGFLAVYEETPARKQEVAEEKTSAKNKELPLLTVGEVTDLIELLPEQHFTQPPPRYSEASLVKALEEHGIGRPSTYAPIVATIQTRGYVIQEKRRLRPTDLGFIVNDLLVKHFPDIVNTGFTAEMEAKLDRIAAGDTDWVPVIREFYGPFSQELERAAQQMERIEVQNQPTGENCEKCGHPLVIKRGRYGKFIACSNYPECRNTKPYLESIGVACPKCNNDLVVRRTRKGRVFYGCSTYPDCDFSSWKRPLPQPCPNCGGLLVERNTRQANCTQCEQVFSREDLQS
jgi:DNA topoisomerase-1